MQRAGSMPRMNENAHVVLILFAVLAIVGAGCTGDDDVADDGPATGAAAGEPDAGDDATSAGVRPPAAGAATPDASSSSSAPSAPSLAPPVPYENPVLARDFADPTVIRTAPHQFYAYATGGLVQRAMSTDLVHWQTIADALAAKPSWASAKNAFWAPHVVEHGGTYFLYFAAEQNAGSGSFCVGVATAPAPDAGFVDVGAPIVCSPSFQAIDPMAYDDPATGARLLFWGSGFGPIQVRELAPDRAHFAAGSSATALLVPSTNAYERLIEGAWLHEHAGTYYLFSSGDDCCGGPGGGPHYAVMVSRATKPQGPYEDIGPSTGAPDNTILVANARWLAPGHNAVITDDAGVDWLVYHAFDTTRPGARMMLIDRISYVGGWPSIAGRSPSQGAQSGPVWRQ